MFVKIRVTALFFTMFTVFEFVITAENMNIQQHLLSITNRFSSYSIILKYVVCNALFHYHFSLLNLVYNI